jgi:hypothetical protein
MTEFISSIPPNVWHKARGLRFDSGDEVLDIELREGEAMVVFMRGRPPHRLPVCAPGEYEMCCPIHRDGNVYPVMILVVPEEHVDHMLTMDPQSVDELLAAASAPAAGTVQ